MKTRIFVRLLPLLVLLFTLGSCGSDSGNAPTTTAGSQFRAGAGVAQKGPLQLGSLVTTQELDAGLSPTGRQFTYQITSDLGNFSPTAIYSSPFVSIFAFGYYFDEVTNTLSGGVIFLNAIADLRVDTGFNVNLLTTLAYQRIRKLVATRGMSITAARAQAEAEVLAALNIPNGNRYGAFGSLDLSRGQDGDNMLAAISSMFVLGNNASALSALIANFQSNIAENGTITLPALKANLANSAKALNLTSVAANLNAKYAQAGANFTAAELGNWIDQDGDGVVGNLEFQLPNAGPNSVFTFPSSAVDRLAGMPIAASAGQLTVNGSIVAGEVNLSRNDTVTISPLQQAFPGGVLPIYLKSGSTNVARVSFVKGLAGVAVTTANSSIARGATQQFIATATFTDNSTADVSSTVAWSMGNTSVANISASGLVTGVNLGTTSVTATLSGISGSTALSVSAAALQSIIITPPSTPTTPYTGIGLVEQLRAIATYTDSTTADVTNTATWTSGTPSVAIVNAATGLVTGIAFGTTTITATLNAIAGSANFFVTDLPWRPTANMSEIRRPGHTATLLNTGKVLVAGGTNILTGAIATTDLYDPVANTWSPATTMSVARLGHTAILLSNGKVLVAGGSSSLGIGTNTSELYDPTTNTWSGNAVISQSSRIEGHTATLLNNGKVLIVGGYDDIGRPGGGASSRGQLYDPFSNTWSSTARMNTERTSHSARLLANGKVLVMGGDAFGTAELYDPATDTWSNASSMSANRAGRIAILLNSGKVLVSGGDGLRTAELYDPITNTWAAAASMASARQGHAAVLLSSGKVLVMGGDLAGSFELYDPATNSWSSIGNGLILARRIGHTSTLLGNGKVLLVGTQTGIGEPLYAELSWRW